MQPRGGQSHPRTDIIKYVPIMPHLDFRDRLQSYSLFSDRRRASIDVKQKNNGVGTDALWASSYPAQINISPFRIGEEMAPIKNWHYASKRSIISCCTVEAHTSQDVATFRISIKNILIVAPRTYSTRPQSVLFPFRQTASDGGYALGNKRRTLKNRP